MKTSMKEFWRNLFQEKLRYDSCKMTMTSFHSNKSLGIRAILRNDFIKAQELNTKASDERNNVSARLFIVTTDYYAARLDLNTDNWHCTKGPDTIEEGQQQQLLLRYIRCVCPVRFILLFRCLRRSFQSKHEIKKAMGLIKLKG